jgi:hypothetical protein
MPASSVSIAEIIAVVVMSKKVMLVVFCHCSKAKHHNSQKNFLQNKHFTSSIGEEKIMLFGIFF